MACVRTLLELGADASHANVKGGPQPVHRAAASGLPLLSFVLLRVLGTCGNTYTHPGRLQYCNLTAGNSAVVELLLQHGADVNAASSAGSPLLWAAGVLPHLWHHTTPQITCATAYTTVSAMTFGDRH